jgi:1,4-alpha-glucan branching enzyme
LLDYEPHQGVKASIQSLNALYRKEPALFEKQFSADGFEWIDYTDSENSVLAFVRKGIKPENDLVVVLNMTPVPRESYRIGLPEQGKYRLLFNSDSSAFGGSDYPVKKQYSSEQQPWHGRPQSVALDLPPLSAMVLKRLKTAKKG